MAYHHRWAWLTPAARAAVLACAAGCVGTGEDLDASGRPLLFGDASVAAGDTDIVVGGDAPRPALLSEIQEQIFTYTCAKSSCHSVSVAPHGLILTAALSYRKLVGVGGAGVDADEASEMKLVVPGDPDESYLMVKILPDDSRNRDRRMPRDGPPYLSGQEIEMIRSWIAAGALDN